MKSIIEIIKTCLIGFGILILSILIFIGGCIHYGRALAIMAWQALWRRPKKVKLFEEGCPYAMGDDCEALEQYCPESNYKDCRIYKCMGEKEYEKN